MTLAIAFGDELHSPYPNLAHALLEAAARVGDGHFLSIRANGTQARMTWAHSLARAWRIVGALQAEGFAPGAALVLRLQEADEIVSAIHAGILGGYVVVPMTGRIGQPLPQAVLEQLPQWVDIDPAAFLRLSTAKIEAPTSPVPGEASTLRFGIATSGTTGAPRLVGLSDAAALARWWPRMPQASHARGFLSWTPFDHVMGIGMAMPDLPIKVHLSTQRFISAPLAWLDALVESGATHATTTSFGLDLVVQALARAPERKWDLSHVQRIGVGAETVSRVTAEAALRALASFGLREDALIAGYGLSECGPVAGGGTSLLLSDKADETPPELDRPTAGHAVRIVDAEGALLNEGEIGAIEVRGPTMTAGYIGDPEANRQLFTADHWLRTGDLGLLRQGRLTVTGRAREQIVVHARKYACQEIEAVLRQATGQREIYAAPLAAGSATAQAAPCGIYVVCADCPEPQALAQTIARTMARAFKFVPAMVSLLSPDLVPRTASGKVRRLDLPQIASPNIAYRAAHKTASQAEFEPLLTVWREILQLEGEIDPDEDFFLMGGDSLMAVQLAAEIERLFGRNLNFQDFPQNLSLRTLSAYLGSVAVSPSVVAASSWRDRLQHLTRSWPGIPGLEGGLIRHLSAGKTPRETATLFWCTQAPVEAANLAETLAARVNTFVLRSGMQLFHYDTPESRATALHYAEEIQRLAPDGPLIVGGNCQGATMMNEIIPLLRAAGREIELFVIADANFLRLSKGKAFDMPIALIAMSGSTFNPQRWFRHPEAGLRKYAPKGLKLAVVPGRYSETWRAPHHRLVGEALVEALQWARAPLPQLELPAPNPLESSYYKRGITVRSKKLTLFAGEEHSLRIRLTNKRRLPWLPFEQSGLALGNHWTTAEGEMLVWADGRTPLPVAVASRKCITLTLPIRAPDVAGPALLEVDLVEEGVCWFAEMNGQPLQIRVFVKEAPKPGEWWAMLVQATRRRLRCLLS